MKCDFGGYATKASLRCADGLTIQPGAFKGNHGKRVPLVWQHNYDAPDNILGHALLQDRDGDVYTEVYFNNTEMAKTAKELVKHDDIKNLSIAANKLKKRGQDVIGGDITEVSLVISGANPGAFIDFVNLEHSSSDDTDTGEAIIYTGLDIELSHADADEEPKTSDKDEKPEADEDDDRTVQDVLDTLNEDQRNVVAFLLSNAAEAAEELKQSDQEGPSMQHNIFESKDEDDKSSGTTLTHSQVATIIGDMEKYGTLKDSVLAHAGEYGIENIDILFPDAKAQNNVPDFIKRKTEWVSGVLSGTHHSPFSRVKTLTADITHEEARARGYIKGNLKKDEFFRLATRAVSPTTIYKKQRLDRDDIVDITSFDVVAWIRAEMRMMLEEELARAILVGDGRPAEDPADPGKPNPDKIDESRIIPIYADAELYTHRINVSADLEAGEEPTPEHIMDAVLRSRKYFLGTGTPKLYTTTDVITDSLLLKDGFGHRLYKTEAEVAAAMRVSECVEVPVLEGVRRTAGGKTYELLGIIVNLADYTVGADNGGQVATFDDFNIDYNQYRYLIETRCSGALTKIKSAIVIEREVVATEPTP